MEFPLLYKLSYSELAIIMTSLLSFPESDIYDPPDPKYR